MLYGERCVMKHWFVQKRFGWGWVPATWEGWLVTLLFAVAVLSSMLYIESLELRILALVLLTVILIKICYVKGEKPRWRWG